MLNLWGERHKTRIKALLETTQNRKIFDEFLVDADDRVARLINAYEIDRRY